MEVKANKHILISGGTGLVGTELVKALSNLYTNITILVRKKAKSNTDNLNYVYWNPEKLFMEEIDKPDIIINLAGASIADGRWTDKRKKLIIESRTITAATIEKYIKLNKWTPQLYISASAVGYYGDRKDEMLTEESSSGSGFLSECCKIWESTASSVGSHCQRTIICRLGVVFSQNGGALPKILMTRPWGFLSYFGTGKQFFPWIDLSDVVNFIIFSINHQNISGIYNLVSPFPITNKEAVLHIKQSLDSNSLILPVPTFILRLAMGEMANIILNSNKVSSQKILDSGFTFQYPKVQSSITHLCT